MRALVAQLCLTLCDPIDCSLTRLLCPGGCPGKNTDPGGHFLLQGIFPAWGSNLRSPESPALQADSLLLSHQKPSFHQGITQNPSFNAFSVITLPLKQKLWLASSIRKAKAQNPISRLLLPSPTLLPLHPGVAREALEFFYPGLCSIHKLAWAVSVDPTCWRVGWT